ncbi:MAG: hypothetical protein RL033_3227 [Pseudomonadota bacterium]|jgi:hypothetical protein
MDVVPRAESWSNEPAQEVSFRNETSASETNDSLMVL